MIIDRSLYGLSETALKSTYNFYPSLQHLGQCCSSKTNKQTDKKLAESLLTLTAPVALFFPCYS